MSDDFVSYVQIIDTIGALAHATADELRRMSHGERWNNLYAQVGKIVIYDPYYGARYFAHGEFERIRATNAKNITTKEVQYIRESHPRVDFTNPHTRSLVKITPPVVAPARQRRKR